MTADPIIDPPIAEKIRGHSLILYDGDCGFCDFWVRFIIARDPRGHFLFAPLQSELGRRLCMAERQELGDTVLVYSDEKLFSRSDAVARIAARLSFPWNLARVISYAPRAIRDWVYNLVARNRHRVLKMSECPVPSVEDRHRFVG